ncbi:MAG: peptidase S74, partial [Terriglobales bacterium]
MNSAPVKSFWLLVVILCSLFLQGQVTATTPVVPRLVSFSSRALDAQGKALVGVLGLTFSIYKDQFDGSPLWLETQNVQPDSKGNYAVQLGAATSQGLPLELFASGEARWLGVRVNGAEEQPRVLLLSVPYALKAADAQTLGGLPASAFALAGSQLTNPQASTTVVTSTTSESSSPLS